MIPLILPILTLTVGMLALVAIIQARAHPPLAFAQGRCDEDAQGRSDDLLLRPLLCFSEGVQQPDRMSAPSWPGYLPITLHVVKNEDSDAGDVNDSLNMKPRDKVRERIYGDCLDSFEACRDHSRALVLKIDLLSRHPGYRKEVRRAFKQIYS